MHLFIKIGTDWTNLYTIIHLETSTDKALVMSKVITKSKFGAPSNTFIDRRDFSSKKDTHPSDSRTAGIKRKHTYEKVSDELNSSVDDLSSSLIAMTPPSSPQTPSHAINVQSATKVQISHNQLIEMYNFEKENNRTISNDFTSGDAEHLVNEHFKNCGYGKLATDTTEESTPLQVTVSYTILLCIKLFTNLRKRGKILE